MRADNTAHLATAAQRRHELARAKTIRALRELDQAGSPVTFPIVARHAGVSRSWLYTQPDITAEIHRLRTLAHRTPTTRLPAQQRGSDASLRQRLHVAQQRNRQLAEDNQQLRRQLAQALGQLRTAGPPAPVEPATKPPPNHRRSITIGPC
ncbi:DUF6262 family protein [Solwaraspora sp. WMMB335]|uniref:DUF6262 family protein n=1 Tax=Solwaraspora sp. WMMB335 TaxID=3404118 RepID=UPI003B947277